MELETKVRTYLQLLIGQKQRLKLFKNPRVLIFDEATASLIFNNQKQVNIIYNLILKR